MISRTLFLKETLKPDRISQAQNITNKKMFTWNIKDTIDRFKGTILIMLVISCISGFSIKMIQPFLVVYGIDVLGLNKLQWGTLQTIKLSITTALYIVGGMLSDRFGRIPCILVGRFVQPLEYFGLIFLHDYSQLTFLYILLGAGGGMGGSTIDGYIGGPSWQALLTDIVPQEIEGRLKDSQRLRQV